MPYLTDDSHMPFGKHMGTRLGEVPAKYLLWLADQPGFETRRPDLYAYIEDNREALETEVETGEVR
jgi:hypothetical protein